MYEQRAKESDEIKIIMREIAMETQTERRKTNRRRKRKEIVFVHAMKLYFSALTSSSSSLGPLPRHTQLVCHVLLASRSRVKFIVALE